jgi:hypothetical protein
MTFNVALSLIPVVTIPSRPIGFWNLVFCAPARTECYAGEGEVIFGLTKYDASLAAQGRAVNRSLFGVLIATEQVGADRVGSGDRRLFLQQRDDPIIA